VLTGNWSTYVITSVRKFAPTSDCEGCSGSMLRSVFVTWLNGLPFDSDRAFLQEMQVSAAAYQTHSLAIANSYYDRGAVSYERLLRLVNFCEAYAKRSTGSGSKSTVSSSLSGAVSVQSQSSAEATPEDTAMVVADDGVPETQLTSAPESQPQTQQEQTEIKSSNTPPHQPTSTLTVLLQDGHIVQPSRRPHCKRRHGGDIDTANYDHEQAATKRQMKKLSIAMNVVSVSGRL
jgi:hypothetical protein